MHTFHAYTRDDVTHLTVLADGEDLNAQGDPITTFAGFCEFVDELISQDFFGSLEGAALCHAADLHMGMVSK